MLTHAYVQQIKQILHFVYMWMMILTVIMTVFPVQLSKHRMQQNKNTVRIKLPVSKMVPVRYRIYRTVSYHLKLVKSIMHVSKRIPYRIYSILTI
jgi:hypothetical protein